MSFPDVTDNVNMIIKKMNNKQNNISKNKYESCKRLESIMKKILMNPNISNEKVKLYDIEHPILKYINIIPGFYNAECDEIYNLMMDVNRNHPKINFAMNGRKNMEYVEAYERKDKLIFEFY